MRDTRTDWIQTYTGVHFRPFDPAPEDVRLEDIAHALATKNRWTGHAREPISIAEHSLRVAWRLAEVGCSPSTQMAGLLHDAGEAYLPDVASPVKGLIRVTRAGGLGDIGFAEAEVDLLFCIYRGLGLPWLCPEVLSMVKLADLELLVTEARDLMHGTDEWPCEVATPLRGEIIPMDWHEAESTFLYHFNRVLIGCKREAAGE